MVNAGVLLALIDPKKRSMSYAVIEGLSSIQMCNAAEILLHALHLDLVL